MLPRLPIFLAPYLLLDRALYADTFKKHLVTKDQLCHVTNKRLCAATVANANITETTRSESMAHPPPLAI